MKHKKIIIIVVGIIILFSVMMMIKQPQKQVTKNPTQQSKIKKEHYEKFRALLEKNKKRK